MLMKKYLFLIAMSAALLTGCNNDNLETPDRPTDVTEQYDFEKTMEVFDGIYYGDMFGKNGEHRWYTYISDIGFSEDGFAQPNGTYFRFDIYDPAPEDTSNPLPPAGKYVPGEKGSTEEMTITPEFSEISIINSEGWYAYHGVFTEGYLTIAYEGENMIIETFLTDDQGKTFHVKYNGPARYTVYAAGASGTADIP